MVITGAIISRQAACARGIGTPSRASRRAGSTSRAQGSRRAPARARRAPPGARELRTRTRRHVPDDRLAEAHGRRSMGYRCRKGSPRNSRDCGRSRCRIEVDRVPAPEEAGHDGLGDARGERGGHRGVGGRAAVGEDLGPRFRCGWVPGRDGRDHETRSARRLPKRPKPSRGKSKRSCRLSPDVISKVCGPIGTRCRSLVVERQCEAAARDRDVGPRGAVGIGADERRARPFGRATVSASAAARRSPVRRTCSRSRAGRSHPDSSSSARRRPRPVGMTRKDVWKPPFEPGWPQTSTRRRARRRGPGRRRLWRLAEQVRIPARRLESR